jgi:putative membrane protein
VTAAEEEGRDRTGTPRRPRLHELGEDPDVRYTYANERTFLSWSRTSLALIVTGIAVLQLLPAFHLTGGRRLIGLPLIVLGSVLSLVSWRRWYRNEKAMRLGQPLPPSELPLVLAVGVALIAVIAIVVAVVGQ